jgi:hypothetical protein
MPTRPTSPSLSRGEVGAVRRRCLGEVGYAATSRGEGSQHVFSPVGGAHGLRAKLLRKVQKWNERFGITHRFATHRFRKFETLKDAFHGHL